MKNKWILACFGLLAVMLMAATIPTTSSFLGVREKGIGIEVTSGGDIKFYPKTTVGTTTIANRVIFTGNMSFTNSTLTLDSTLTLQNGATLTNPDSLVFTEAAGIKLANDTRINGLLTGRAVTLSGTLRTNGLLNAMGVVTIDNTLEVDSTITAQNGATITNPDSLVFTESTGIVLGNDTRVKGALFGRAVNLTGTLTMTGSVNSYGRVYQDNVMEIDSTLTMQSGGTITNPDSLVFTESTGIIMGNDTRVKGALTGRAATFTGTVTIPTDVTGVLKATSGVVAAATADVDYVTTTKYNLLRNYLADGLLIHGTMTTTASDSVKFKTTTTAVYTLSGVTYTKAATDNLVFTAAHTVNTAAGAGQFYGIILVQINPAGVVSTKVPSADQTYASDTLAIAALPAVDTGNDALGYILIYTKEARAWTANTSDLFGVDCATVTFTNTQVKALPAAL